MKKVSVIIPNYNCARWLPLTLSSCVAQGEDLKEIIVVDDFSEDDSWEILENYSREHPGLIKIFRNETKGGNNARNLGFAKSAGEFIQWLDADDQLVPGKFSSQLNFFDINPNMEVVFSDWVLHTYRADKLIKVEQKTNSHRDDFLLELLRDNWSPPNCYLLKRSLVLRLNDMKAWNSSTSVGQDREYFTLAALCGANAGYVPGVYAIYNRWNKSSVSAVKAQIRFANMDKMLSRFEDVLENELHFTTGQKQKYKKTIVTQKLVIMALGYHSHLHEDRVSLFDIDWSLVKGMRTRLKTLVTWARYNLAHYASVTNKQLS
jgi:glycosyltransferase involved in cell wall biosynthesis